jgi:hypothetical protein
VGRSKSRNNKPKEEPDELDAQLLASYILTPDKSMDWHAEQLGVSKSTVSRRWGAFADSEWFVRLVPRLERLAGIVFANVAKRIISGDYEATRDYLKGLGVYADKHKHDVDFSDPAAVRALLGKIPDRVLDELEGDAEPSTSG